MLRFSTNLTRHCSTFRMVSTAMSSVTRLGVRIAPAKQQSHDILRSSVLTQVLVLVNGKLYVDDEPYWRNLLVSGNTYDVVYRVYPLPLLKPYTRC